MHLPAMKRFNCRSYGLHGPTLWNKLSQDVRMLNFVRFESSIKTELYLKCFEA